MIVDENGMCTLSEEDYSYHSSVKKVNHATQADCIRGMSDEDLAKWLTISVIPRVCEIPLKAGNEPMLDKWLDWLKSEVDEI